MRGQSKNDMTWRIKVTFDGKLLPKEYITPDIRNTDPGWGSELFNRAIERLEFYLPTGHTLILSGMEEYNFFIEASQDLGGKNKGKAKIDAFWFCGKMPLNNLVEMWRVGDGEIIRERKIKGFEYDGGATRGWKKGSLNSQYLSRVIQ
jgi:hypothetical protein